MQKNNIAIRVTELTKKFTGVTAVDRISFNVNKGEIFGFLGPNGAGKTTTIRILTGLLTQDCGDVFINNFNIKKNPIQAKKQMGIIPEMGNIYTDLTAKENIILAGRFYGISKKDLENKAANLLEQFGLYERRNDPGRNFSAGMKQRINIASAIIHDPEILFLDEPTSWLDVQSQRLIRDIIKEMNQKGTTIFLTTHNIEEANILCERVGIINKGKIAAIDTPERLKKTFEKSQSVIISFNKQINGKLIEKNGLVARVERMGDKLKLFTANIDKLIKYLTVFAEQQNLKFTSLTICRASLEEIFIQLTEEKSHEN